MADFLGRALPAKSTWIDDVRRVIKREHGKGWRVDLPEPGPMCSAQRKRYLRLERERLLPSVVIPTDEPLVERPT